MRLWQSTRRSRRIPRNICFFLCVIQSDGPTMPTATAFLQAESVSREYRLAETIIRAVDSVSLTVENCEFIPLLWSYGSCKSKLLSIIAALHRPTSDAILLQELNLA